jgi:hypothetical protein
MRELQGNVSKLKGPIVPRYFTHYWKNETWEKRKQLRESGTQEGFLYYAASNSFVERGVKRGDVLYPVTVVGGTLYLLGRLEVDRICDFEEAASMVGTGDLWEARDYAIPSKPSPIDLDLEVPPSVTRRLMFISGNHSKRLKSSRGGLDRQTLRGIRELHPESAAELDKLLTSASHVISEQKAMFEVGRIYNRR